MDLKQVWFSGSHSDVGGGYAPGKKHKFSSDIPLDWMIGEAEKAGLSIEPHLKNSLDILSVAEVHDSSDRGIFQWMFPLNRPIDHGKSGMLIHKSVVDRWVKDEKYRPKELKKYVDQYGWNTVET